MLYESYRNKTLKIARFLGTAKRFRVLIISITLFIVSVAAVLMGVSGLVYFDVPCPTQIAYGETLNYQSGAIFQRVWYEYAPFNTEDWTIVHPLKVGNYQVRSVSQSITGKPRYGKVQAFAIAPKVIDVGVSVSSVVYGEIPAVGGALSYEDNVSCSQFAYADISQQQTSVTPDLESVRITNAIGEDVTNQYQINCVARDITFEQRNITVVVADHSAEYNGDPLTFNQYEVSAETPLAWDDQEIAVFSHSQTEVGEAENTPQIKILNAGREVTCNYNITVTSGKLSVYKRVLYLKSVNAEKDYDGTPLIDGGFVLTEGALVKNHVISSINAASITDVGTTTNLMSFYVHDLDQKDVSQNYNFVLITGELKVKPRAVTIKAKDTQKIYDGMPLYCSEYEYGSTSPYILIEGHTLSVQYTGSQTTASKSQAIPSAATVLDADGKDMTANYQFTYEEGTLTIVPRPIIFETLSSSWEYDGTQHTYDGHQLAQESEYGLLEGHISRSSEWTAVTEVAEPIDNCMKISVYCGEEDMTDNYVISIIRHGAVFIFPRAVIVKAKDIEKIYDDSPLYTQTYEITSENTLVGEHQLEQQYDGSRTDVIEGGTEYSLSNPIPESTRVWDGERDVTFNYFFSYESGKLTILPRSVTFQTATESWVYDDTDHFNEGIDDLTAETENKGVVVDHVAMVVSHTLVHNVLGTPTDNLLEVAIFKEKENKTENYTIEYINGTLTVIPRPITFQAKDIEKEYDSTPLIACEYKITNEGALIEGHIPTVSYEGSQTDVYQDGEEVSLSMPVVECIKDGEDVVTNNYAITCLPAKLNITARQITVKAKDNEKVYDGIALVTEEYEITSVKGLIGSHTLEQEYDGSRIDVEEGGTEYSISNPISESTHIFDGEREITFNYAVSYESGTLAVTPRPIIVTANSGSKVYDDVYYQLNQVTVSPAWGYETALVLDHQLTADTIHHDVSDEAYIFVGEYINSVDESTIAVFDDAGVPKHTNYSFTCVDGTLTITKRSILIQTGNRSEVYGDVYYVCDDNAVAEDSDYALVKWHNTVAHDLTSIRDVGEKDNEFYITIHRKDLAETEVTGNYEIAYRYGKITVTKRPITVQTASKEWTYADEDYMCGDHFVTDDSEYAMIEWHTSEVVQWTEICNVNELENVLEIAIYRNDVAHDNVTDNYEISYRYGKLTVIPRPVTFETDGHSWVYDDRDHFSEDIRDLTAGHENKGVVIGHTPTVIEHTVVHNVLESPKENVLEVVIRKGKEDVSENYAIDYENGILTVTVRPITIKAKDIEKIYDGTPLFAEEYEVISQLKLLDGHEAIVTYEGSQTDVRRDGEGISYSMPVVHEITKGGDYVTNNYDISSSPAELNILPRPITIKAKDNEKIYDDTPLYTQTYEITSELGLVAGHSLDQEYDGSRTGVKEGGTDFDVSNPVPTSTHIWDGEREVTFNYKITYQEGKLTIIPRPISIMTHTRDWVYDGGLHYEAGYDWEHLGVDRGLLTAHETQLIIDEELTNVTAVENYTPTAINNVLNIQIVRKGNGEDVTENYEIEWTYGQLTISKRDIRIIISNNKKTYDGTPYQTADIRYYARNLVSGWSFSLIIAPQILDIGILTVQDLDITYKAYKQNGDLIANENLNLILPEQNVLTIEKRSITITSQSVTKEYDGTPLVNGYYDIMGLLPGDSVSGIVVTGVILEKGSVDNTITTTVDFKITNSLGVDVTQYYDVGFVCGTLTIIA